MKDLEYPVTCGRQNNGPPTDVHDLIPRIRDYVTLHNKRELRLLMEFGLLLNDLKIGKLPWIIQVGLGIQESSYK